MDTLTLEAAGRLTRVLHLPGPGPAVVLLHGASGRADTWLDVSGPWRGRDLWIPDLPGRGAAAQALDTVAALAGWLAALLAQTTGPGATVVGHSLGGAIGLQLALDAPGALERLALVSSAARLRVAPPILEAVSATTEDQGLDLSFAFGPGTPAEVVATYHRRARGVPVASALADWRACDGFDVRDRLGEVAVPTRVIFGTEDWLAPPRHQGGFAAAMPRAEAVPIAGHGHMLPWEAPGALAEAVLGWGA